MDLLQNPFFLLGATTRDNRSRIFELAQEKSLLSESEGWTEASSILIHPRKRLTAEVAWLLGLGPKRTHEILSLLKTRPLGIRKQTNLPPLARANLLSAGFVRTAETLSTNQAAEWIIDLAETYEKVNAESIIVLINEERGVSRFPEVREFHVIEEELEGRRQYFRRAIKIALDRLPMKNFVQTITLTVEMTTEGGEIHAPFLIENLLDSFEVEAQNFFELETKNIGSLLSQIREAVNNESDEDFVIEHIIKLEKVVRNWDFVAQPIQISYRSRGFEHSLSHEIADKIRSLSIDLYNEYELLGLAKRFTMLLEEVFAEVDEIAEQSMEDSLIFEEISESEKKLSRLEIMIEEKKRLETEEQLIDESKRPSGVMEPYAVSENSIGMKFVLVPPGKFFVDKNNEEAGPAHEITLTKGFWMGQYSVTQRQWEQVMQNNPSEFTGSDRPVENVSWYDVQVFIQCLNRQEKTVKYKLPTAAEWEYACRAGNSSAYSFGDDEENLGEYAWYEDNSRDETLPVGLKKPNAWGLYDMHGNVWEWCEDGYGDYPSGTVTDLEDLSVSTQGLRGGAWSASDWRCRSDSRLWDDPDVRLGDLGFRLVKTLPLAADQSLIKKRISRLEIMIEDEKRLEIEQQFIEAELQQKDETKWPLGAEEPFSIAENSIGMKFVLIPPGKFIMGDEDEGPEHEVTLTKGFWIGKYPVTQAQWEEVMQNNPSHYRSNDRPVDSVSWYDVQEFIERLNGMENLENHYRLPTEAQWEYACRGGTSTEYCFGDSEEELEEYAWYDDNSRDKTHPVGQKKPNAWGLNDMHGNVWEWCQDCYGDYPSNYLGSITDPQGPSSGSNQVLRGGCWGFNAWYCRSAYRIRRFPRYRNWYVGFRLVLPLCQ